MAATSARAPCHLRRHRRQLPRIRLRPRADGALTVPFMELIDGSQRVGLV
ncbi:hypothetical protein AB5I41_27570 [Sphingomonas sp. MMS24-JH45]